jgi:hypothetical protein
LDDWLPSRHFQCLKRQLGAGAYVSLTHDSKRFIANDLAAVNQLDK